MISKTAIIPWHEFQYMPLEMINSFCRDKDLSIRIENNSLHHRYTVWMLINKKFFVKNSTKSIENVKTIQIANHVSGKKRFVDTHIRKKEIADIISKNMETLKDTALTNNACSIILDLSPKQISKYRRLHGIEPKKCGKKTFENITEKQKKLVLNDKLPADQCSKLSGLTVHQIWEFRKQAGVRTHNGKKIESLQK